jgi:hypothetical protein
MLKQKITLAADPSSVESAAKASAKLPKLASETTHVSRF